MKYWQFLLLCLVIMCYFFLTWWTMREYQDQLIERLDRIEQQQ